MNDEMDEISFNDRDTIKDRNRTEDRDTIKDNQGKKESFNVGKAIALLILFSVCIYLMYAILSTSKDTKKQPIELPKETTNKQTELFQSVKPTLAPLELVDKNKTLLPKVELPTPTINQPESNNSDNKLLEAAQRAPVLAYSNPNQQQANTANNNDNNGASPSQNNNPDKTAQQFNQLLKPTKLDGIRASTLGNRNYIIAMGASIPCILETAVSSEQQGFVSCIVSRDILSDNGRVVLLDKGTQIVGEYRAGLKKGQTRLFVLWNRAKTPSGVIITLGSPATDALGRSGIDGDIDNHWFERLGSALLVSIVRDATNYANDWINLPKQQKEEKETTNILSAGADIFSSGTSGIGTISAGVDMARMLAENYINIPPTLTKNQGEMINVFVVRDLDFSTVYKLKIIENNKQIIHRAFSGDFNKNSMVTPK
ncbi:Type IV secretion system protein VirB10 [Bartonella clarridgeiae 73]|uniref:Type IV secretion system protein VirB10 n=1 Tax=Bartonella clarridgeiae (strain CCUG 45776 / CIP 104772 / 73) TaxID=696125 RepID=E6YFW5_BARC7|nr:type IV secretion system protein VirB10 [Bartonella clarridgeiae]WCR55101.1 MAG: Inner membrane protein of type IV secretion of T-DNA complex TonB-like VirB10 [Bartonella clarridgeiae]WCR55115.1 MAG: Inner membrane protein of type IV secretion of T-DNA complex TonB-like VirB10 [Bartonella clarridgeiae]WCR55637.1 MAG: Inner membrane protein of type IV secretion of T-DNA complex TonB-like VirB10 [Bartonella clarridgeiae]CBI75753.1 Type IV secretion system protein VirB10 [Bartonella clarridgeia